MDQQLSFDLFIFADAVGDAFDWVTQTLALFMVAPAIYFVGFAVAGAAASVALKFISIKKR